MGAKEIKDLQFTSTCPSIEEAGKGLWNWEDNGGERARTKFYEKHLPHAGINIKHNDGSSESFDLGNPDKAPEVYWNITKWKLKIHAIHMVNGLIIAPSLWFGFGRLLDAAANNDPQVILRFIEAIPGITLEIMNFTHWGEKLKTPDLVAQKYSEAIKDSNVRASLGVAVTKN